MFMHNKRLQYTVRVSEPNPVLASLMLEQFGGADGELAAAMRYFTQGLGEDDAGITAPPSKAMFVGWQSTCAVGSSASTRTIPALSTRRMREGS